jgi:hypothetical protein
LIALKKPLLGSRRRSSGVQEFRSSGVQEFRSSGWRGSQNCKEKRRLRLVCETRPALSNGRLLNS